MSPEIKHTILIVDDEDSILKSLRRLLNSLNVNILTASGGDEALRVMEEANVSMIISDQRMPGMNGLEFLQHSKKLCPDCTRVLLTGYTDIEDTIEAINSGAIRYYINKPWDDEFLISQVKESLALFEMTRENKRLNELTRRQNAQLKKLNSTLEQRVAAQTEEIRRQHEELHKSFMETIKAFSTIVEIRFKDVGSHSQRVAALVRELLKGFELDKKEYQDIIVAAYLHDIGKLGIPDRVYHKTPEQYTIADIKEINRHPILGQSCVLSIRGFEEIGLIIRHHHEAWDGSGYPDRLCEDSIPLGSRLINIADAFDHEAFLDGYPNVKKIKEATAHLVKHTDIKFDPDLVKLFIDLDIATLYYHSGSYEERVLKPCDLQQGMIVSSDVYTQNGMFVVPKEAKLSPGMVKRIIKIDKYDSITDGIRVYTHSIPGKEGHAKVQSIIGG